MHLRLIHKGHCQPSSFWTQAISSFLYQNKRGNCQADCGCDSHRLLFFPKDFSATKGAFHRRVNNLEPRCLGSSRDSGSFWPHNTLCDSVSSPVLCLFGLKMLDDRVSCYMCRSHTDNRAFIGSCFANHMAHEILFLQRPEICHHF